MNKRSLPLRYFTALILILFSLFSVNGYSQNVEINFQTLQKDFPSLERWDLATSNQFLLTLSNKGQETAFVKLGVSIEGNGIRIATHDNAFLKPIEVAPFSTKVLLSSELAEYFTYQNLQIEGANVPFTSQELVLPEGSFSVCVSAYDFATDAVIKLGKESCDFLINRYQLPPLFIAPKDNSILDLNLITQFSWVPRHYASSLVDFEFMVFEDEDGLSDEDLKIFGRPIISNTSSIPQYLDLSGSSLLVEGKQYKAFVRAFDGKGVVKFKNGGYSDPLSFSTSRIETKKDVASNFNDKKVQAAQTQNDCGLPGGVVLINELNHGPFGSQDAYLELLVVGNGSGENVDLSGFVIDDNNYPIYQEGNESGHIVLGECFNDVAVGTLIVIKNGGSYTGDQYSMIVDFSHPCIIKKPNCPNASSGNSGYNCSEEVQATFWNNLIPMRNLGDVAQVRNSNGALEHALLWETQYYEYLYSRATVVFDQTMHGKTMIFNRGNRWNLRDNYEVLSHISASPGLPNSPDNALFIDSLRLGFYDGFAIECDQISSQYANILQVDVFNGNGVYQVSLDGGTPHITSQDPIYHYGVSAGPHSITVKDTVSGCIETCSIIIEGFCTPGEPCNDNDECTENDVFDEDCNCIGEPIDNVTIDVHQYPNSQDSIWLIADLDSCSSAMTFNWSNGETGPMILIYDDESCYSVEVTCACDDSENMLPTGLDGTFEEVNGPRTENQSYNNNVTGSGWSNVSPGTPDSWISPIYSSPGQNGTYDGLADGVPPSPQGGVFACAGQWFNGEGFKSTVNTIPGTSYTIKFWQTFAGNSSKTKIDDECHWNIHFGDEVKAAPIVTYKGEGQQNWEEVSLEFVAATELTVLKFKCGIGSNPASSANYMGADDVKLLISEEIEPCDDNCSFIGEYGSNCELCDFNTPCDDGDPCTTNDIINEDCECQGLEMTDSDEDTVCDEEDICPGFDDFVDFDEDGIPDGCDTMTDCSNLVVDVLTETILPGNCDYVLNIDSLLGNNLRTNVFQVQLGFDDEMFTIEGSDYFFPQCYGQSGNLEEEISFDDFESDWGFWAGLSPFAIRTQDPASASNGEYSIRLSDDSEFTIITSQEFFVNGFDYTSVSFNAMSVNFNSPGDFLQLQASFDSGQSFEIIETWSTWDDLVNDSFEKLNKRFENDGNSTCKIRFKVKSSNYDEALFIDEIRITRAATACDKLLAIKNINIGINNWLEDHGYSGTASNGTLQSLDSCADLGSKILVQGANIEFFSMHATVDGVTSQETFCTEGCTGTISPDTLIEYTLQVNCGDPSFEWSNGTDADSLLIPSSGAYYTVTVTCANACDTIINVGDPDCIPGTNCDAGPCFGFNSGYIDEYCNCVSDVPNTNDADEDGIVDCEDDCPECAENDSNNDGVCDCDEPCFPPDSLVFNYDVNTQEQCMFCVPVDFSNSPFLNSAVVSTTSGQNINISNLQGFDFPYCYEFDESTCYVAGLGTRPSLKKFATHFYHWTVSQGQEEPFVRFDTDCIQNTMSFVVEGTDYARISLRFESSLRQSNPTHGCYTDTIGYDVMVEAPDDCDVVSYLWSNGETGSTLEIPDINTQYYVAITCADGCVYSDSTDLDCYWGASCTDYDTCTVNDQWDAYCNCVGEYSGDDDLDGYCNVIDQCPDFPDYLDDDGDGVPNYCDSCIVVIDTLTCNLCVDLQPYAGVGGCFRAVGFSYFDDQNNLVQQNFSQIYSYRIQGGFCPNQLSEIRQELQDFIDNSGHIGQVSITNNSPECAPGSIGIKIDDSSIIFRHLYVIVPGGLSVSLEFGTDCILSRSAAASSGPGSPCDDEDICTVNDVLDEYCTCKGTFLDTDVDGICDSLDCNPLIPNFLDGNNNGIPDGCEPIVFPCNGLKISFCEYFDRIDNCPNKFQPFAFREFQDTLKVWLQNTSPTALVGFDVPGLMEQLENPSLYDNDEGVGDGIIEFFDICPDKINTPSVQNGFYRLSDFSGCCDDSNIDTIKASLISTFFFQAASYQLLDTITGAVFFTPECLAGTDLTFVDGLLVDADSTECAYRFEVDCNCNCTEILETDVDHDGVCDIYDDTLGVVCHLQCPTDLSPCTMCQIVGNPAYDAFVDNGEEPCMILLTDLPDEDNDGICDPFDECPGMNDTIDIDMDGIPDCIDGCTSTDPAENWMGVVNPEFPQPTGIGDPCDDGNPCTYADSISVDCICEGIYLDFDGDAYMDCGECLIYYDDTSTTEVEWIEVSELGPFINCDYCYSVMMDFDGVMPPDTLCDKCPDLDDALDYNGNGVPDCLDPPFYEIGCPDTSFVLGGQGFVMVFNSDDITLDQIPQPVEVSLVVLDLVYGVKHFEYLLITNIREVDGTYEVYYEAPGVPDDQNVIFGNLLFAEHQSCPLGGDNDLIDIVCPSNIGIDPYTGQLTLDLDFTGLEGSPDFGAFMEGMDLDIVVNGTAISGTYTVEEVTDVIAVNEEEFILRMSPAISISGPVTSFSGTITLANGIECEYTGGTLNEDCDTDGDGIGDTSPGAPCPCDPDVMDCDCFHHFRLDNDCNCIGDAKPDQDDDGICDEEDPCPEVVNPVDGPDNNGDGYPDCPCPELILSVDSLSGGSDLNIEFDTTNMSLGDFASFTFEISGGPDGMINDTSSNEMPMVVANLPKGYTYEVTIIGHGVDGCESEATTIIDVPFETNPVFCGIEISNEILEGTSLLDVLNKGETFTASDFDVKVKKISGGYGKYTGVGYIKIPYFEFARINVSFEDIYVSTEYKMVKGVINVDGYGVALLGDDMSDAINEGINNILTVLTTIDEILEEITPILDAVDELVIATGHLVDEETKNCLITKAEELKALKLIAEGPNPPSNIVDQIKTVTEQLEECQEEYDAQINAILNRLPDILNGLFALEIVNCSGYEMLKDSITNREGKIDVKRDAMKTDLLMNGLPLDPSNSVSGLALYGQDSLLETAIPTDVFDPTLNTYFNEFYEFETKYQTCLFLTKAELIASDPEITASNIKLILTLFLDAGIELSDEIAQLINEDKTNEEIITLLSLDDDGNGKTAFFEAVENILINKGYGSFK